MELTKILEMKENEISNKHKEIDNICQENKDLKEKLKVNTYVQFKIFQFHQKLLNLKFL